MNSWVSLLRGINVGPTTTVKMDEVVSLYKSLGLKNVRTYMRSGNVLFESPQTDPEKCPGILEKQITLRVGFPVKVLIRSGEELRQIISNNPFLSGESGDITRLHVTFLSKEPPENLLHDLIPVKDDQDRFIIRGKEVYLFCPGGYGRTRFSNAFFEKNLGMITTTRNWRTVTVLSAMAGMRNTKAG
jgi:uncharacterized protein (DUF1697 family)